MSASLYRMGLSIAFAQLNPTVGDVAGNLARVRRARDQAAALGADLVVFPELVLVGYPPEDLVLRPALVEAAAARAARARAGSATGVAGAASSRCPGAPTGASTTPSRWSRTAAPSSGSSTSCPTTASSTRSASSRRDRCRRRSRSAASASASDLRGHLVSGGDGAPRARAAPSCCSCRTDRRSRSRSSISASSSRARGSPSRGLPLAYVNQVGGQDELVFDGGSFVMNPDGTLAHLLPFWREAIVVTTMGEAARRLSLRRRRRAGTSRRGSTRSTAR